MSVCQTRPVLCNSNSVKQPFFLALQRGNGLPMSQVVSQRLIHRDPEEDQFTGSKLSKPMDFRAEKHPHELAKEFFFRLQTLLREMTTVTKAWKKKNNNNNHNHNHKHDHNCDGSIFPAFWFFSFPTSKFLSPFLRFASQDLGSAWCDRAKVLRLKLTSKTAAQNPRGLVSCVSWSYVCLRYC